MVELHVIFVIARLRMCVCMFVCVHLSMAVCVILIGLLVSLPEGVEKDSTVVALAL